MSLLAPLFMAGLLAAALPVVFHLIRRSPRGQTEFSSLMFLSASPPRITRRSRLDHLLLLLLRAVALGLLAFAFARPFLRESAQLDRPEIAGARVAVLVDTSASMRRGDLWQQAISTVDELVADADANDQLAVFTFDETLRPLAGFEELAQIEPQSRRDLIAGRLQALTPSWSATHLGEALIGAVDALNDVVDSTEQDGRHQRRIVLVADLQQGSRTDELAGFDWPANVNLDLKRLQVRGSGNAGLHGLAHDRTDRSAASPDKVRVRVSNSPASDTDQFQITWIDQSGSKLDEPVNVYVPAGESRIVRVARPLGGDELHELRLAGDDHEFDNSLFLVPRRQEELSVVYLGNDTPNDSRGHRYYLELAFPEAPWRTVRVVAFKTNEDLTPDALSSAPLVVVAGDPSARHVDALRQYVAAGGTALAIITEAGPAPGFATLLESPELDFQKADVSGYTMLGQVDFDHSLFAPFAAPQFNDFTKIRFWKYRRVDESTLPENRVLARFENGDPAWIESTIGDGKLHILTAGWQPADSQLARSTKFVPLLLSLLAGERVSRLDAAQYRVNQPVPLGRRADLPEVLTVHKPDGATMLLRRDDNSISETSLPGVYRVELGNESELFAVNLSPAESKTAPLEAETLEQWGVGLAAAEVPPPSDQLRRQMRDVELESRQKLWQWLILAALGVLILETFVAGRLSRPAFTLAKTGTVTA